MMPSNFLTWLTGKIALGSAAAKAGVHVGECIIKVNGVTVTSLDHLEVVKLISVAPYTTLTLSGGPSSSSAASSMGNDHYEKRDRCLERRSTENAIRPNSLIDFYNCLKEKWILTKFCRYNN
ncbi:Rho guanine nucleotide exchange factor 11 [Trichinella spiralis]|uniref:Rho guanine nucleotide exchange factor 11 n=1 Tax=Trichinella spiralis TaxID=6334 RepID=UPI0001EFD426|nr:Rho guanine nucleotide exchange factor 11 [Trichinella spiralis]